MAGVGAVGELFDGGEVFKAGRHGWYRIRLGARRCLGFLLVGGRSGGRGGELLLKIQGEIEHMLLSSRNEAALVAGNFLTSAPEEGFYG